MTKRDIALKNAGLICIDGCYRLAKYKDNELNRYTGYISWDADEDECDEEIDVDAPSQKIAKDTVVAALKVDYNPGWKKIQMSSVRVGLYM